MKGTTMGRWHDRGYLGAQALEDLQVVVNKVLLLLWVTNMALTGWQPLSRPKEFPRHD